MPDVFISYTRGDRKRVALIAEALEAEGFKVWWDASIKPGKAWHDMLRKQLQSAHCVIVCWSRAAAKSDWVLAEATQAYNQQKLVPTTLQACDPPMPFNMVQSADLTAWRGEADDEYWVDTLTEIRRLVEKGRKLLAAIPPPGEAHGAELAPSPRVREPAPPASETLPPPREPRAPRYQASRGRKKMGPRAGTFIAGTLITTAALTGALWAGPQAFDYIKAKLNTPPTQTAAIDTAPAEPTPLAVEPLPATATEVEKTQAPATAPPVAAVAPPPAIVTAPPPVRPPVTTPPVTRPPTPVVDRPPVVVEPPKVTVTVNDMEGCMQQIAKACGASASDFRVDGQFSVAERRLMRTALFPDGATLTELNLAACKAGSTRRAMTSDDGRAACAAIAPPAPDPATATPPVRLTPILPTRPTFSATPQPEPRPTRPPVSAGPAATAPPTTSTPTTTGVITRTPTLTQRPPTTGTSTTPAIRLQQPMSRTFSAPSAQPPSGQQIR